MMRILLADWPRTLYTFSSDFLNYISSFKTPAKKIAETLNGLEKGHPADVFQLLGPAEYQRQYLTSSCIAGKYQPQQSAFRRKVKAEKLRANLYNSANATLDDLTIFPLLSDFVLATGT
ncbi:hypothetical protein CROQUDRAFT_103320 [Cronartium quercuum f. sp. fusiforme G11]|uniref:Uncharacterized protein n=1 Tax=Cronartium quercuum f. sp. fusiforme G11 TaxID=708437 RepID=A0A9P6THD6_9BASI|nr:hypothetical protein CROQUDRAFT_103320 [Cronartium quercuum f. sp. fusiforme G11]